MLTHGICHAAMPNADRHSRAVTNDLTGSQVRAAADDGAGASRQDDPPAFGSPGWRSRPAAVTRLELLYFLVL